MVVSHIMLKTKVTKIQFQNVFSMLGMIRSSEQENICLHNNRGNHRCGLGYTNCGEEVLYFKRKLKGGKLLLDSLCFLKYIIIHFDGCIPWFSLALLACYLAYKSIPSAPCEYSSRHCLLHLLIPMFDESISWLQRINDSEIPRWWLMRVLVHTVTGSEESAAPGGNENHLLFVSTYQFLKTNYRTIV